MPIWTNSPPADDPGYPHRIVRTPPDKPLTAIITCSELVGVCTHYAHSRTVPCEGPPDCPWCADGHSWRWHGYASCVLCPSLQHVLLELTAAAVDPLRTYHQIYGDLRGCKIVAQRPSKRPNGRVLISCQRTDPLKTPLPDPPDIKRVLCHVWSIPYSPDPPGPIIRPPARQLTVPPDDGDGRYRPRKTDP